MSKIYDVVVLVGSLRKESLNRKMAKALATISPATLKLDIVEIGQLPHYNQDLEADLPGEYIAFRQRIAAANALLFITPEYNRSVPGVLKNAIDVASRPSGKSVWNGKPAAVISLTSGALGAFGANHHLRQSLVAINVPAMAHPEAYIGHGAKVFDDQGQLVDDTRAFMDKFLHAFARWVERNAP